MSHALQYQFDHVHVLSLNPMATEKWFVEGLGAQLVERRDSRGIPATVIRLGGVQILIRGLRDNETRVPATVRQFGTDHFGLRVADVDATVEELRGRGVTIEVEPWDFGPNLRIAFIKGPDDIRIELVQPH